MTTLPMVLREVAARYADKPSYVEAGLTTTYGDLLERVEHAAAAYVDWGLEPGQRLGLWAPNSVDWVVAALAASYAGGVLIPLNSRYTAHEVADILDRADAGLVVVADRFLGRTQIEDLNRVGTTAQVIDLAALSGHQPSESSLKVARSRADAVAPDDIADILFTSGTTGRSKGVMSGHRQTVAVARAWAEAAGVREDDRYLAVSPFFHTFGYKVGIVVGLVTGCTLYPMSTFDVDTTMRMIDDERITVLPGAPTIYQSILTSTSRETYDLTSLRLAVTGAAVVPVVLVERMREDLAIDHVVTAFGMTEAPVVTMCRGGDSLETVAKTSGRAIPGMQIRIDEESGELLVRGDHIMLGYLDDAEATAAAIDADGWLHTGDIGTIDANGNLRITDRLKDMYISGGFNVYPAEIEQELLRVEGVEDVAVVGVPDERLGEVGKAYVVGTASAEAVVAHARERLANYKIPRYVESIRDLPRTASGKVRKTSLRGT